MPPEVAEGVTGVPATSIVETARTLLHARPVASTPGAGWSSTATPPRRHEPSASSTP
jgi:anaerobic selenocysteine-containing dehydrogenase